MSESAKPNDAKLPESDAARIERARLRGRRVGVIFMLVFGTWFVLTTVYNFAVDVFGPLPLTRGERSAIA